MYFLSKNAHSLLCLGLFFVLFDPFQYIIPETLVVDKNFVCNWCILLKECFNIPVLQIWVSNLEYVWEFGASNIPVVLSVDFFDSFHYIKHLVVVLEHQDKFLQSDRLEFPFIDLLSVEITIIATCVHSYIIILQFI